MYGVAIAHLMNSFLVRKVISIGCCGLYGMAYDMFLCYFPHVWDARNLPVIDNLAGLVTCDVELISYFCCMVS